MGLESGSRLHQRAENHAQHDPGDAAPTNGTNFPITVTTTAIATASPSPGSVAGARLEREGSGVEASVTQPSLRPFGAKYKSPGFCGVTA